jgi:hypothetical protein
MDFMHSAGPFRKVALAVVLSSTLACAAGVETRYVRLDVDSDFEAAQSDQGTRLESTLQDPGIAWDELVASWNADLPDGETIEFFVEVGDEGLITHRVSLGRWSKGESTQLRRSVPGQESGLLSVRTDLLKAKRPVRHFRIVVECSVAGPRATSLIRYIGANVTCRGDETASTEPLFEPTPILDVPRLSQLSYPDGSGWCSPTSLAMVLHYWALQLERPDLKIEVPVVAAAVLDPEWPGTGNWSFNVAYAGSLRGMRGIVARLPNLEELHAWVSSGIPVVVSVAYSVLLNRHRDGDDGHLLVVVGFPSAHEISVNDPGTRLEMRRTFDLRQFGNAWAASRNTAYLVYPIGARLPATAFARTVDQK